MIADLCQYVTKLEHQNSPVLLLLKIYCAGTFTKSFANGLECLALCLISKGYLLGGENSYRRLRTCGSFNANQIGTEEQPKAVGAEEQPKAV